ncbi:MAG: dihydrodipicolinate synthase family protein [Pyrinomonadaceae bacterium]
MKLKGIVPPIGTPVTEDERVDEKGLRNLVRHLIGGGVHGVFVNGTMGCFALLTDEEQIRAVEIVADEVGGRVPVVAGVSDTGTNRVIKKIKQVEKFGVDFITAVPPYYFRLGQTQGVSFFRDIAQAAQSPVLIYNNPYLTKLDLDIPSLIELSKEPNIVGLKETNQDCNRWTKLFETFRGNEDFSILLGTELLIAQGMLMGADGAIGGAHNIAPAFGVGLYDAAASGDYKLAMEFTDKLSLVCKVFEYGEIWGGFEAALQVLGICEKTVFAPYQSATDEDREGVRKILEQCGLLTNGVLAKGDAA